MTLEYINNIVVKSIFIISFFLFSCGAEDAKFIGDIVPNKPSQNKEQSKDQNGGMGYKKVNHIYHDSDLLKTFNEAKRILDLNHKELPNDIATINNLRGTDVIQRFLGELDISLKVLAYHRRKYEVPQDVMTIIHKYFQDKTEKLLIHSIFEGDHSIYNDISKYYKLIELSWKKTNNKIINESRTKLMNPDENLNIDSLNLINTSEDFWLCVQYLLNLDVINLYVIDRFHIKLKVSEIKQSSIEADEPDELRLNLFSIDRKAWKLKEDFRTIDTLIYCSCMVVLTRYTMRINQIIISKK